MSDLSHRRLDEDYIQQAYQEQIGILFKVLCSSLRMEDVTSGDKTQIEKFKKGVIIARHAKEIAKSALI